jgi:glycogen(starch) synthase
MRTLVVTNMYPPHALGGYEMSCRDVMTRFAARGHEVLVLTTETRLAGISDVPEPDVRRELKWYWDDHRILRPPIRSRLGIDRHNRAVVARALDEFRPDVVSMWAMGAMSLGLIDVVNKSGRPAVYVICDEWPVYGPRLDGWLSLFAGRRHWAAPLARVASQLPTTMREPQRATYCWLSDFVRERVVHTTGWHPEHETVTYTGIDPNDFPVSANEASAWRWRLLAVGRVEPRKGFSAAIEALPSLPPEATLRIVGPDDGEHRGDLARLATRLGVGDRVSFATVPRAQLRDVYRDADVFVFTSAWQEPFGLVPVEAMACGTPVIAAATGGATEYLVDEVNSLVVPPGDAAAIAQAVQRLAADAALRDQLRRGGTTTADDLSVERLTDVLEQWHGAAAAGYVEGEPPHRPRPARAALA